MIAPTTETVANVSGIGEQLVSSWCRAARAAAAAVAAAAVSPSAPPHKYALRLVHDDGCEVMPAGLLEPPPVVVPVYGYSVPLMLFWTLTRLRLLMLEQ